MQLWLRQPGLMASAWLGTEDDTDLSAMWLVEEAPSLEACTCVLLHRIYPAALFLVGSSAAGLQHDQRAHKWKPEASE